jgi:hypothetical protein
MDITNLGRCLHIANFSVPRKMLEYVRFQVFAAVTMKNALFWNIKNFYLTGDTLLLCYSAQPVNVL